MSYEVIRVEDHDRIIRLIGSTAGLITAPEDVATVEAGDASPALWGRLSLVSFQSDGTLAALDHIQGRLVDVYGIAVLTKPHVEINQRSA